ncbi:tRNA-intron endonuclease [Hysterangium stoloniferum]|nr:tRNA-intron endonuclease [Hysterangium stoloniferum]
MTTFIPDPSSSKARGRQKEVNKIYAYPLPLLISPLEPPRSWTAHIGLFSFRQAKLENPQCEGIFDLHTRSVWIINSEHSMILWRRGFFGKGSLSRSEPSWLTRRIHEQQQRASKALTAEEVTAKRRAERQRFKLDRAQAFAASVAEAEAAFAAGDTSVRIAPLTREAVANFAARSSDRSETDTPDTVVPSSLQTPAALSHGPVVEDALEEELPEDLEHLQLTLPEAFFLIWSLDCLRVLAGISVLLLINQDDAMKLSEIWTMFQCAHHPIQPPVSQPLTFDNPFLVHYALYHHYRSLGWVIRSGIKFCADYLLYKRGPVFHHAEFAVTLCPVYEDEQDRLTSPFNLNNATPFSWTWLSTINRVNTQVQKTLILAYVTIPSSKRVSPTLLSSPACLAHYSVREVILRRFVPARMRD